MKLTFVNKTKNVLLKNLIIFTYMLYTLCIQFCLLEVWAERILFQTIFAYLGHFSPLRRLLANSTFLGEFGTVSQLQLNF